MMTATSSQQPRIDVVDGDPREGVVGVGQREEGRSCLEDPGHLLAWDEKTTQDDLGEDEGGHELHGLELRAGERAQEEPERHAEDGGPGVLTPHAATGPEAEFPQMAPGVLSCVARVSAGWKESQPTATELRALTASPLDEAAATFDGSTVDAIAYASTTSAYAIGFEVEQALVSRLAERLGTPVASTCASAVLALHILGAERIALVHPPWFDAEENDLGTAYFQSQGFDVVSAVSADLPGDPRRISTDDLTAWTAGAVSDDTEAVFVGGNGFRATGQSTRWKPS
jgi:maleate isomerase